MKGDRNTSEKSNRSDVRHEDRFVPMHREDDLATSTASSALLCSLCDTDKLVCDSEDLDYEYREVNNCFEEIELVQQQIDSQRREIGNTVLNFENKQSCELKSQIYLLKKQLAKLESVVLQGIFDY